MATALGSTKRATMGSGSGRGAPRTILDLVAWLPTPEAAQWVGATLCYMVTSKAVEEQTH
jgi:hypothetical protein